MRGKGRRLFNRYYGYSPDEPHSLLDISNITGYDLFHIERTFPNKLYVTEISYARGTKC